MASLLCKRNGIKKGSDENHIMNTIIISVHFSSVKEIHFLNMTLPHDVYCSVFQISQYEILIFF
jgi:hypothetical protein